MANKFQKGLGYLGRAYSAATNPVAAYQEVANKVPFLPPVSKIPIVGPVYGGIQDVRDDIIDKVIVKPIENIKYPKPRPPRKPRKPRRPPKSKISPWRKPRRPLTKRQSAARAASLHGRYPHR